MRSNGFADLMVSQWFCYYLMATSKMIHFINGTPYSTIENEISCNRNPLNLLTSSVGYKNRRLRLQYHMLTFEIAIKFVK
jgi:hypothetical protein